MTQARIIFIESSSFLKNDAKKKSKNFIVRSAVNFTIYNSNFSDYLDSSNSVDGSFLVLRTTDTYIRNSRFSGARAIYGSIDSLSTSNNSITVYDSIF